MSQSITAEQLEQHKRWLLNQLNGMRLVLCDAVLCDADLRGADLSGAVLCDADLRGADLRGAVLSGAVLSGAVLRGAVLCDADLRFAVGNMREVKSAQFDTYRICWWQPPEGGQILQIGCQRHPLTEWQSADAQWIANMAHNAAEWWAKYGAIVLQLVEASPAVPYGRPKDEP